MRRSVRLEAANGKKGGRISEMIARHADQVRKDDAEEEWKPAEDGEVEEDEDEEDNHSSDSDFSEEERPRTRAALRGSKRRIQVSSSDSSGEEETVQTRVKREPPPPASRGGITKAREVMSRIRERDQQTRGGSKRAKLHQIAEKSENPATNAVKQPPSNEKVKAEKVQSASVGAAAKPPVVSEAADAHRRPSKQQQRVSKPTEPMTSAIQHVSLSSAMTSNTVTHFFNEILEWSLYDALRREALKEYDFSEANDGSEEGEVEIAKVPSQFDSYDHYFSVWKPLALEEVQAQTVNSVTTDRPSPAMITTTVLSAASFASKTSKVRVDFKKRQGLTSKRDPSKVILDGLYANDLVLITPDLRFFDKALATSGRGSHSHSSSSQDKNAADTSAAPKGVLGIISSQRSSREGLIMSVLSTAWNTLDHDSDLYLFKLNNLITSVREFRALCDCREYQLMPLILSGHHESGSMRLDSLGLEYVRWLTRSFNESQLEAITAAATSHGFTLIKGPPGTGKTTTLKGLLNSLHLREYSRYYNAVLEVARRPDHETNKAWAAIGNEKPHILVTAPSNAAVDNIVAKVIEEGFCDGEGRRYFPKIVRVGRGMSASVRSVGLEDMVDQICSRPVDELEHHILRLRHELVMVERDAVSLREHLRQIVGWIDRDPAAALAAQLPPQQSSPPAQPQPMQPLGLGDVPRGATSPPPPPPPLSPPPAPPGFPPYSHSDPPSPPTWSPGPSTPPSPPGPASPLGEAISSGDASSFYPVGQLDDEEDEEEEDEEFPVSYGENSTALAGGAGAFNAQESGKAFSAFLDDDSSADEDEPLPTGASTSEQVSSEGTAAEGEVDMVTPVSNHEGFSQPDAEMKVDTASSSDRDTAPIVSADEKTEDSTASVPSDDPVDQLDVDMTSDAEDRSQLTSSLATSADDQTDNPSISVEAYEGVDRAGVETKEGTQVASAEEKPSDLVTPVTSDAAAGQSDVVMKSDAEDESDEDEPLPQAASVESDQIISTDPATERIEEESTSTSNNVPTVDVGGAAMAVDIPNDDVPSSPPPPPPPLSPPPPPPLSPPPPLNGSQPSSPTVMPLSPVPQPQPATSPATRADDAPIDYTRYQEYRAVAQQINFCLEKLSEVKLELQRYEFARKTVAERGKLNPVTRQSLEVSFLDTAHIVFTTLSSAGVAALDASSRYDVLVVDEAAQAVELSTIIPMKFGSRQCVLVGDPQQLSATVFSRTSGQSLYERSLFERLESCGHPVHMLRTQYRSHPMISDFPRHYFYDGKLQDGENVQGGGYVKPYHQLGPAFTPLVFWNLLSSRETSTKSVSRMNVGEAELAVNLYLTLKKSCPPDSVAGKVGMITPYSQQMEELRSRFRQALGKHYDTEVEINTVDGFQGREKDIIILSTVRADPRAGVGFLNDIRRMNVALTRAKFACYVIGSEATLRSSKPWTALLDHAYNRHCVVHVENPKCNLLTLQPMTRPEAAHRAGGQQPPPHFPPPQLVSAPFAPPHQQQQQQQQQQQMHGGWHHDTGGPARSPSFQGQGRRGRGRGGGDGGTRGRGGRRSGSQRGGRSSQAPGRGRGGGSNFQAPQPFHASELQPGGGGWHPAPDMMPLPPQGAGRGGRGGRALVRGRGLTNEPQPGPPPYTGAFAGGQVLPGPPPPPPPPQAFYQQQQPSGYNGPAPINAQAVAGRGGARNPRDPRFRAGGRGFNSSSGAGRGGAGS